MKRSASVGRNPEGQDRATGLGRNDEHAVPNGETPNPGSTPETGLVEALTDAREAIASLDTEALGMAQIGFGEVGVDVYPIRDELLAKIDSALSNVLPDEV